MHLLLEKITVIPAHDEGGEPRWYCTRPTEQHAIGVWTWRRINGAWMEGLFRRTAEDKPFDAHRIRLVVEDWYGMPSHLQLFDAIGEIDWRDDLADRLAQTEMLMGAMKQLGERG